MNRLIYRIGLTAAVLLLMTVVFAFSAQPGEESDALTQAAVMPLAELIAEMQQGDEHMAEALYAFLGSLIRKAAHLCEFALLGLLLYLTLRSYGVSGMWWSLCVGILYAASDEIHQLFVPGRLGCITDVLIDAIGVALGVFAAKQLERRWRKKHVQDC